MGHEGVMEAWQEAAEKRQHVGRRSGFSKGAFSFFICLKTSLKVAQLDAQPADFFKAAFCFFLYKNMKPFSPRIRPHLDKKKHHTCGVGSPGEPTGG
jgi:hypothetical protein